MAFSPVSMTMKAAVAGDFGIGTSTISIDICRIESVVGTEYIGD